MEPKKNPKSDVSRNSSIYFAVGLALMLAVTYLSINYKTYNKSDIALDSLNLDDELDEEIPITEQIITPPPPPPPPPAAPEIIEVVEDEEEVEETVIESTETEMDTEIVEVEEVEVEEVEEDIEVPFSVIENVAVFPGCEKKKGNTAKKACMNEKVNKFINKKFNTDLASDLGLPPGKKRIFVAFKVDKSGNITSINARGPHPGLEKEAKRVIGLLPKMKPGRQRGKAVVMPFSIPIVFQVQD
tara:strand:+ start:23894 stop:24622 length:729 start_codon:yes stop_codon:yes gene_type:complete